MTTTKAHAMYTTSHPITGETVEVTRCRRTGVQFATWAKFSTGWAQVGTSAAADMGKAIRSAKSTAPYATEWTATPVQPTVKEA